MEVRYMLSLEFPDQKRPSKATFKISLFLCLSQKYQTEKPGESFRSKWAEDWTWLKITLLKLYFHSDSALC